MKAGNCHPRRYVPKLLDLVRLRQFDPSRTLADRVALTDPVAAYGPAP